MKYELLTLSSDDSFQYDLDKKSNLSNRSSITYFKSKYYEYNQKNDLEIYETPLQTVFTLDGYYSYNYDREELLFRSLINQRKVHRYYKAITEYEQEMISEEVFEKLEDNCILSLNNDNEDLILEKLLYFYDLMKKYAPEEIEFMNNEDLAELLSVPEHKINKLHYKIDNEQ